MAKQIPDQLLSWKIKLKELITSLGLTQGGFAQQIGVRRRAVCRWLDPTDASIPHMDNLQKIKKLMEANDPKTFKLGRGIGVEGEDYGN
ncbi:MAG: hypothetical protein ACXABY_09480 [Candidatus Thorarchaeota archaeon]|jgi:hypothetical protein